MSAGNKRPLSVNLKDDIRILVQRYKISREPWIHYVSPAWIIHGGREPRIQTPIVDQWTGAPVVRELEDGDTMEEAGIKNGAVITVLTHSDDYAISFFSWNAKGALASIVR